LSKPEIDICIIGGGVIGTAIARQMHLSSPSLDILLVERNQKLGMITSSRNSEVLHAGLYYPPNSLKAKHCLAGHRKLIKFCEERHIQFRNTGKLIVANKGEEQTLYQIERNAKQCGVTSLKRIKGVEIKRLEPDLDAHQALFSPATAIIDSHQYMLALQADIAPSSLVVGTELISASPFSTSQGHGYELTFNTASDRNSIFTIKTRLLINAAGIAGPTLARQLYEVTIDDLPLLQPAWLQGSFEYSKGSYFSYMGRSPFRRLVYPVPTSDGRGLGIHATLDLSGQCRFGPDVERLQLDSAGINAANHSEAQVYQVCEAKRDAFIQQISRYFPALEPDRLQPAYSGIRCQWRSPEGHTDFQIDDQLGQGIGLLQYLGIDSPGLTASLSLAADAVKRIKESRLFN